RRDLGGTGRTRRHDGSMMTPLDPIRPSDASSLAMENELLRYEVAHVRARMAEMLDRSTSMEQPQAGGPGVPGQQAYDDLVWLLRGPARAPAGVALRRVRGFRILRERYLSDTST